MGKHLIAEGLQPGPHFKDILNQAFKQLEDGFRDEAGALLWLRASGHVD